MPSSTEVAIPMKFRKVTVNTWQYDEEVSPAEAPKIKNIYISKSTLKELGISAETDRIEVVLRKLP